MTSKFTEIACKAHSLKKSIKSTDEQGGVRVFCSKNQAGKYYKIAPAVVYFSNKNEKPANTLSHGKICFQETMDLITEIKIDDRTGKSKFTDEQKKINHDKSTKNSVQKKAKLLKWLKNFKNI